LTLVLSEDEVSGLLDMKEVVAVVEECFRRQGEGSAVNSPRTRSSVPGAVLNVMHASLPYLGRAGMKCYLGSKAGTRFVFILFDLASSAPLAVMGADILGRNRTGAASAVATKHLLGSKELALSMYGSGKQAITQVTAMAAVAELSRVKVWSPDAAHSKGFSERLKKLGIDAKAFGSPEEASAGSDVGSAITSSKEPYLTAEALKGIRHLNLCGANYPDRAEATPEAVGSFSTVAVDDLAQAKAEAGDLIQAAKAGRFDWGSAVELEDFVCGRVKPSGRTLFKSGGVALEDVAVGSLVYDKAVRSGAFTDRIVELGF